MSAKSDIGLAHEIATILWDEGLRGQDGLTVLEMAMGIYMDAQEGSHGNLKPIADGVCEVAQIAFDALNAHRNKSGHA